MKIRFLCTLLVLVLAPSLRASDALQVTVEAPNGLPGSGPTIHWDQRDKTSHFHVLVTNISDTPQRIWQDWTGWGYFNLRLEFTDADGTTATATKLGKNWSSDGPVSWTLAPHETHVIDVYFADPKQWTGFPSLKDDRKLFTIRAIYESLDSAESKVQGVWTGKVISQGINALLVSPP